MHGGQYNLEKELLLKRLISTGLYTDGILMHWHV